MNTTKRNRNLKKWTWVFLVVSTLLILSYSAYNLKYIDIAAGIFKIEKKKYKLARVSLKSLSYISLAIYGDEPFIEEMKNLGWEYYDKFGRGYLFIKDGEEILATRSVILGRYTVFEVHNREYFENMNLENSEQTIN